MPNQNKDYTESKLYLISYYLYSVILTSFYFILTNVLFVITVFLALISFQERFFTVPVILTAIIISLIPMGPAWAATLFSVKYILENQFYSLTKNYFKSYNKYFKKSLLIWLSILSILILSFINYWVILSTETLNVLIFPLFAIILITVSVGLYVFPLLIDYSLTKKQLLKLALYFSFKKVFLTAFFLLFLIGMVIVFVYLPLAVVIIGPGGFALCLQYFCRKVFKKVHAEEEQM